LLTSFAVLALLLAAIGMNGVVHYAVAERTREIGVRVALGASPATVMKSVILHGVRMPLPGVVVGVAVSVAATRVPSQILFEIGATDPLTLTFAAVLTALIVVALVACVLPARRATRVDPITVLR
jgi:putative ABC transport system permease protein